jgi:ArsR family transcriptional regulator
MNVAQLPAIALLRVLADPTRLRLLALLRDSELSVGEMARALAMGQSRISNHLKILREHELVSERHAGSFTYCRLQLRDEAAQRLWAALEPSLAELDEREADQRRLAVVLAERSDSRAFFDRIAGDWDLIGSDFLLGSGRLEVLGCLVPDELVVADVGCGTGYLARALARRVSRVICIDTSPAMIDKARQNLVGTRAALEFRTGSMESLPLSDGEVDAACAHMVLHHLGDLHAGLGEMARAVRPGGRVACVELLPHHESWMQSAMADARLGVDPAELEDVFQATGLDGVSREILADSYVVEHPSGRKIQLPLYLIHGRKAT